MTVVRMMVHVLRVFLHVLEYCFDRIVHVTIVIAITATAAKQ